MRRPAVSGWLALALAGGLAYPFLVYFGLAVVRPAVLLLLALGLMALRMLGFRRHADGRRWLAAFMVAALGLAALSLLSQQTAVKAYPIAVSLAAAAVFGLSLRYPPTVIERFARTAEPDLSPEGIAYTRKVTWVWLAFLLANAAISAATALWGSPEQWTLWNGLLSYLAMGLLFGAEFLVRLAVRRRHTRALP